MTPDIRRSRLGLFLRWLIFAVVVAVGLSINIAAPFSEDTVLVALAFTIYAAMGGLILARRDGHGNGWLLLLIGFAVAFANAVPLLPRLPEIWQTWVASWGWTAVFALFAALTLTFPSGHPPAGSGGVARLGRAAIWVLPILVSISALTENLGGPEATKAIDSPIGFLPAVLSYPALLTVTMIFLGGAMSLEVRRRRSHGVERAQLTWVVYALVLLVTTIMLTFLFVFGSIALGAGDPGDEAWGPAFLIMLAFPVAFGVAVLRYRLYDIDRIVSRTVTYGVVTATLAAVFFGLVFLLRDLLPFQGGLPVAASTLGVAALFSPLRRRVQERVDRRFNRARYDARLEADNFAERLRAYLDIDDLAEDWLGVVTRTVQPASAAIWLRGGEGAALDSGHP